MPSAPEPPHDPASAPHRKAQPGGGGRDRTDDLKLAKLALSQLSYAPLKATRPGPLPKTGPDMSRGTDQWWAELDLNQRPHAYQARALTN